MTSERWRQIETIFYAALQREPGLRGAFLAEVCAGDPELQRETEALLSKDALAAAVLDRPAADLLAESTGTLLAPGARLGPYQIEGALGAGGMGQVYRALDTRLGRKVAIKIASKKFSERFEGEARSIAALNHPHVCTLHDVGPNYLVMELVEGETLADRLRKGPLPIKLAARYGAEIADAMAAAHAQGIIHHDLKPGNIMLTKAGVKVLDFGLAKLEDAADAIHESEPLPADHAILGTLAYMAPEQLAGQDCDARSDIFALGLVLYEMAAGKRAFAGEDRAGLIGDVARCQPPRLENAPAQFRHVVERCLEKDPEERWQSARDVKLELEWIAHAPAEAARDAVSASRRSLVPWLAAALAIVLISVSWIGRRATRPVNRPLARLDVDLGPEVTLPSLGVSHNVILSPDGTRLAYVSGNPPRLYTRRLDQAKATELPGTDDAVRPFFSPDGQWLGFFTANGTKLNKISVEGGAVVPLAVLGGFTMGGSWGPGGNIIVGGADNGLLQVPASGGAPTTILELAPGEAEYIFPQILAGGKAVLFMIRTQDRKTNSIEVFSFADRRRKTVVRGGASPYYLPSGHLIYTNKGTLFAIAFDLNRLETRGAAVQILDDVAYHPGTGGVDLGFAETGELVYRRGGAVGGTSQVIQWIDGAGKRELLLAKPGVYCCPRISPDGKRLALIETSNVWVYDPQRDAMTRLTFGGNDYDPAWSPDGKYVVFSDYRKGIYWTRADGAGQPQPLTQSKSIQYPYSFMTDGKRLAYQEDAGKWQIWTLLLEAQDGQLKAGQPEQFLKSQFDDGAPAFSPDGHWLAYISDASGKPELYVRAFPPTASRQAGQFQISNNGATPSRGPLWSRNGRELIYREGDRLMAVSYSVNGDSFIPEKPRVWIDKLGGIADFDLAPDGKRVAVIAPVAATETPKPEHEVVLLLNFFDELRRRVPMK
jgi:serine/threonine protein kinase